MNRKLLPILIGAFLFVIPAFSQTASKNLLEKVELNFSLNGEPTPADVGFDNPKSLWKVKYNLYLTDFSELEKIGRCKRDDRNRHICLPMNDKKIDKKIRKKSLKISNGSFFKKSLSDEVNREVIIAVNLQPEVVKIFNQATIIPEKNPTFVLFVTTQTSIKTPTNIKFKKKISNNGISNLKMADSNETKEYWNLKNISSNTTIFKQENGQLRLISGTIK